MNKISKIKAYVKRYGIITLWHKYTERRRQRTDYDSDRLAQIVTEEELAVQREHIFDNPVLISIIVPVYNVDITAFKQTLTAVKSQSYGNWQLCIADAGSEKRKTVIDEIFGDDVRIKYLACDNAGISGNSNKALELADGEYVAFLDHDDIIEPDALFEIMKAVELGAEMIYTDEDKVDVNLEKYFKPYRKPDYNRSLILSNNYICHFTAVKKSIVDEVGGFRPEYDGAQDYDLFLRVIDKTDRIIHIDKVLYHWRVGKDSTSDNPFNKEYAFDAGLNALNDYIVRNGIKGVTVKQDEDPGYYCTVCTKITEMNEDDFETVMPDDVLMSQEDRDKLVARAYFAGADVVIPKIISKGKYVYNGIAKAGKHHTASLKGRPAWYRGDFNIARSNLDVVIKPDTGYLIRKGADENNLKMVYAPEVTLNI